MWKDKLPTERLALIGLLALVIGLGAYVLAKAAHQPAPILFQPTDPTPRASLRDPSQPSEVVVHAVGAVKRSGVLRLPSDSRVDDAINAAGGATADADLESINLAAKLIDGSQVFVPRKSVPGEADKIPESYRGGDIADAYASRPHEAKATSRSGSKKQPSNPVSLNTGSAAQLESLPGVGPSTAQKILEYRMQHGGFSSVDELMAVKGIGPKKMKAMRKFLRL